MVDKTITDPKFLGLTDQTVATAAETATMRNLQILNGKLVYVDSSGNASTVSITTDAGFAIDINGTAGETLAVRNFVYLDETSNTWFKIDQDATPVKCGNSRGVVVSIGSLVVRVFGKITGFTGLTAGTRLYASTTPGSYTQTKPNPALGGGQRAIVDMGIAVSTTDMWVDPRPVQYIIRDTVGVGSSLTVEHHADTATFTRRVFAEIQRWTLSVPTSYGAGVDAYFPLRGPFGAGQTITVDTAGATLQSIGNNGGTYTRVAQQFVPTITGQLSQFQIQHGANVGTPSGNVAYSIHKDNGDVPSEEVLYSGTYSPLASTNNTVPTANGPFLAAGQKYWLRLQSGTSQTLGAYWQVQYSTANPYATGLLKSESASAITAYPKTWTGLGGTNDLRVAFTLAAVTRNDSLAQSFQVGSSVVLSHLSVALQKVGLPVHDLYIAIRADSAGAPGTTLTSSRSIRVTTLPDGGSSPVFYFNSPVTLSASTTYWIELVTNGNGSQTDYIAWSGQKTSPSYANGQLLVQSPAGAWSAATADAYFTLYARNVAHQSMASLGPWDGTDDADFGVMYADSAGANSTTKTSIYNNGLMSQDVTLRVML